METCQIDDSGLSLQDSKAINDIVRNALLDMGIETASFSWCIEVEYTEEDEE
jgi:hypothetical protein